MLGILNSSNSCSAFFNEAAGKLPGAGGESAAQIFSSVDIRLVSISPATAAYTQQGQGADGVIFINKNGAFFNASILVDGKPQALNVANGYPGGFVSSGILVMLHELAHLVNAIPPDAGNPGQSKTNTQTIIDHCAEEMK